MPVSSAFHVVEASILAYLTAFPFVSHEINKHAVFQVHAEACEP